MAAHGKKRHTKRLAAERIIHIPRKKSLWIKTNKAGPHAKADSIPLLVMLRDLLKVCVDAREAKKLLKSKQVLVDGRPITDLGFPLGLMDVLTLKELGSFQILNKGGKLLPVKVQKADEKLCKITGKRVINGGKIQLALHDGRNLTVQDAKPYSTGDTLKIAIPKSTTVKQHLKLEKGSRCYVFRGRHAGAIGSLVDIHVFPGITPSNAKIVDEKGNEVVTLKDYVFVVDKEFTA